MIGKQERHFGRRMKVPADSRQAFQAIMLKMGNRRRVNKIVAGRPLVAALEMRNSKEVMMDAIFNTRSC